MLDLSKLHYINVNEIPKIDNGKPMFGKYHTKETKIKMRNSVLGDKNHCWKGNNPKNPMNAGHLRARILFGNKKGLEKHHIDGNPLNNELSNIAWVTRKQHMEIDDRMNNLKQYREVI